LPKIEEIAKGVLAGDRRSIARAITIIENNDPNAQELITSLYPHTGKAHIIGLTGPGGSGKSTLIAKIIRAYRQRSKTVGVVAVDPTSPFTGGAFLGDRIRMQELSTDQGVFIRSMATRSYQGGIAKATKDAVRVLDAAGKDIVIVETVGAGQSEVEIIKVAQTIVVLFAPGLGDEIQAIKAGIMEIGDIFVVNKADRENADKAVMDIQAMLQLDNKKRTWKLPVLKTVAITGEGVSQLIEEIEEHRVFLKKELERKRSREKVEAELAEAIKEKVASSILEELKTEGKLEEFLQKILEKKISPASLAEKLLDEKFRKQIHKSCEPMHKLEQGLVQVYTGDGKGKTSAAFGLALRAVGRGLKVYVIQFIKGGFDYGELYIVDKLPNLTLKTFGRGKFVMEKSPRKEDIKLAQEALSLAEEVTKSGEYDIVILDEINVALNLKLIKIQRILELIKNRSKHTELVLTGRHAPDEIIKTADLVTEMKEIKHPFTKGLQARKGIEY